MGAALLAVVLLGVLDLGMSRPRRDSHVSEPIRESGSVDPVPSEGVERWPSPATAESLKIVLRAPPRAVVPTGAVQSSPASSHPPAGQDVGQPEPGVLRGEYILSFYTEFEREQFAAAAKAKGALILDRSSLGNSLRVRVRDKAELDALLSGGPVPVAQSPNYRVVTPPSPPVAELVADGNVAFGGQVGPWLGLPGERRQWGEGVKVAVLDTGIGPHPSLSHVSVERLDLVGDGSGNKAWDPHGTAVASLVAGLGSVAGMAPGVRLLDIRVMAGDGVGDSFTLARGIQEAVDRGALVINTSLGSFGDSFLVRQAVAYAAQKGVAIVASVGNEGVDRTLHPAAYEGVTGVGAVDARERTPEFSNRGPSVDLVAPGIGILAAGNDRSVGYFSGTSASAPLVSGAIAALLSREPNLTPLEAAALLKRYADDTGLPGEDASSGAGILDPMRVLLRNEPGIRDVAVSVPALTSRGEQGTGLTATACAQNRGTENLPVVELSVSVDGVTERRTFTDVAPGATVSHSVNMDTERFRQTGTATVTVSASTPGTPDAVPANNTRTTTVRLNPAAK